MLQINFDCLSDQLPTDRTDGDSVPGPKQRRKAVLADAEVTAGQDHDALLLVLADNAQLLLAFSLDLDKRGSTDNDVIKFHIDEYIFNLPLKTVA